MRRLMLLAFVFCLGTAGCRPSPTETGSQGQRPAAPVKQADLTDFIIGQPIRHANLTVFPVSSKSPKTEDRFITLDEGLAAGTVEIFEVGADGVRRDIAAGDAQPQDDQESSPQQETEEAAAEVNRLMVLNRSGKPLYLMPGEVIVGGYQDRTIAREGILCSSDKPVPIDVYCVEHGRWSGRGQAETAGVLDSLAREDVDEETLNRLSAEADRGKFVVSAGNLGNSGRLAVQAGEGQQAVWNEVGIANRMANVQTSSGTFTANYADGGVADKLKAYLEELQKPVAENQQIVGVIVAVNGKVGAVDVFESTPLFKKLWPKLLKSYALDASNVAGAAEAEHACTPQAAKDFLAEAMQAGVEKKTEGEGGLVVTQRSSDGVVSFAAAPEAEEGMAEGAAFGGGVHSAAYAK